MWKCWCVQPLTRSGTGLSPARDDDGSGCDTHSRTGSYGSTSSHLSKADTRDRNCRAQARGSAPSEGAAKPLPDWLPCPSAALPHTVSPALGPPTRAVTSESPSTCCLRGSSALLCLLCWPVCPGPGPPVTRLFSHRRVVRLLHTFWAESLLGYVVCGLSFLPCDGVLL